MILERMLQGLAQARDEKIVVVSNWTSTLNIVQELCVRKRYNFLRLDGSTPQKQRQELVDRFNRGDARDSMVFLLSAKAGGVGLNLIGYVGCMGFADGSQRVPPRSLRQRLVSFRLAWLTPQEPLDRPPGHGAHSPVSWLLGKKLTGSDGQKKPVYIYRLLTTNTIDEKIYQASTSLCMLTDLPSGRSPRRGSRTR